MYPRTPRKQLLISLRKACLKLTLLSVLLIFRTSQQATAGRLSRSLTIPGRKKYSEERAEDSQALEASLDYNFELFQQL